MHACAPAPDTHCSKIVYSAEMLFANNMFFQNWFSAHLIPSSSLGKKRRREEMNDHRVEIQRARKKVYYLVSFTAKQTKNSWWVAKIRKKPSELERRKKNIVLLNFIASSSRLAACVERDYFSGRLSSSLCQAFLHALGRGSLRRNCFKIPTSFSFRLNVWRRTDERCACLHSD